MGTINQQPTEDKIRIADWLVSNTTLTVNAISILTGLDEYKVRKIYNDELKIPFAPINPIEKELINEDEIRFWEQCPVGIETQLLRLNIKTYNLSNIELIKRVPNLTNTRIGVDLQPCEIDDIRTRELYFTRAVKIFWASHGHSAWYGQWSNRFYIGDCFISYQAAKNKIERERSQGRTFTIEELVALCLYTDQGIILIAGINNEANHPFKNIQDFKTIGEFINQIKKIQIYNQCPPYLIAHCDKNLFFDEVTESDLFKKYDSCFISGKLYMKESKSRNFNLYHINRIQKYISSIIKEHE
jgi:hypothetical protein